MSWYDPWGIVSDTYHAVTGAPTAKEKRDSQRAMNDQIKSYKEQTEISKAEIARKKGEEQSEKRRVEEKQIRSLRRNYRAQSFLGNQDTGQAEMNSKLGG